MLDGYRRNLTFYQDVSGNRVDVGGADVTLVTVRNAFHSLFLQKAHIQITGASANKTWQLKDSSGIELTGPFATDTDGSHFDMDFGPNGVQLTEGSNLVLDVSAAGATGIISWEAYQKLTAAVAAAGA